jgi:hypothetical protein
MHKLLLSNQTKTDISAAEMAFDLAIRFQKLISQQMTYLKLED